MRTVGICLLLLGLLAASATCEQVYYRTADGSWESQEAVVTDGRLIITIEARLVGGPEVMVVTKKPDWMVLEDTAPPELTGVTANGISQSVDAGAVDLGCLSGDTAELVFTARDDGNPLCPEGTMLRFDDAPGVGVEMDTAALGPPATEGRLSARLSGLTVGRYTGSVELRDLSPMSNSRTLPVTFTVMGVEVSDDHQKVALANAASAFEMQPHISQQLLLPNGLWAKLTTALPGAFLYPREFTEVTVLADTPEEKTVLIVASAQNLEGEPVEDTVRLEFELTVRPDTRALLVTSRSVNMSGDDLRISPNWGWLACPHYFAPEGKADWSSGPDLERYSTIGHPGWLWLAPRNDDTPGLLWASNDRFGEFMGGSILLYGRSVTVKPGEHIEMRQAFAAAGGPDEAVQIYRDLLERGLISQRETE